MQVLTPQIARHLFAREIYQIMESTSIIGMPFELISTLKGQWIENAGISGEVRFNGNGDIVAIGDHFGVTYNETTDIVVHQQSQTARFKLNKDTEEVQAFARGPHCCARPKAVTRNKIGDGYSEVTLRTGGRTEVHFYDKDDRFTRSNTFGREKEFHYNDDSRFPSGFTLLDSNDVNRTMQYRKEAKSGYLLQLENDNGSIVTRYDLVRYYADEEESPMPPTGPIAYYKSNNQVLIDFTEGFWEELTKPKYDAIRDDIMSKLGPIDKD